MADQIRSAAIVQEDNMALKRFIIERHLPGVGMLDAPALSGAAAKSNAALCELGAGIQWEHSYVTADATFCVYLAESAEIIEEHARISGFPATKITEVVGMIDPTTEGQKIAELAQAAE